LLPQRFPPPWPVSVFFFHRWHTATMGFLGASLFISSSFTLFFFPLFAPSFRRSLVTSIETPLLHLSFLNSGRSYTEEAVFSDSPPYSVLSTPPTQGATRSTDSLYPFPPPHPPSSLKRSKTSPRPRLPSELSLFTPTTHLLFSPLPLPHPPTLTPPPPAPGDLLFLSFLERTADFPFYC